MTVRPPDLVSSPLSAPLGVFADLRMEVDGHRAHLVGDGNSLVLHVDEPLRMVNTLRRSSLPSAADGVQGLHGLGHAATALRSADLTVDVRGPEGVLLLRLGERRGTRLGQLVTGSTAVRFGSVRGLLSTVTATLPVGRIIAGTLGAAVVAGVAVRIRRGRVRPTE